MKSFFVVPCSGPPLCFFHDLTSLVSPQFCCWVAFYGPSSQPVAPTLVRYVTLLPFSQVLPQSIPALKPPALPIVFAFSFPLPKVGRSSVFFFHPLRVVHSNAALRLFYALFPPFSLTAHLFLSTLKLRRPKASCLFFSLPRTASSVLLFFLSTVFLATAYPWPL